MTLMAILALFIGGVESYSGTLDFRRRTVSKPSVSWNTCKAMTITFVYTMS